MEIYRFRTAYALLDGYQELEKQEIFFAAPEDLNDPMEGYRDLYWKGDAILWRNLLKNYLFCLEHIYMMSLVAADKFELGINDIPLFNYPFTNYPPQRLEINRKVRERFFSRQAMNDFPAQLATRQNPVRRNELLSHLIFVQHFALAAIEGVYLEEGLAVRPFFTHNEAMLATTIEKSGNLAALYNQIEAENDSTVDKLEIFFQLTNAYKQGLALAAIDLRPPEMQFSNTMFILNDFNDTFMQKLETLTYPDWYSASFLTNCKNSAIWGHYGNNHKGVCLIYQPKDVDGEWQMPIRMETGYNMSGPTIGFADQTFQQVHYDRNHVEIDFFRSLGRSPMNFLEATWYRGDDGTLSPYASHLHEQTEAWRKTYWKNFEQSLALKTKEWEYEQEYRLTISGHFTDYRERDSRKLQYRFEDLKGLIFGIKTAPLDKLKIMRIINEKCKAAGRADFKFCQAYYSRATRQIEHQEIQSFDLGSKD